MHKLRICIDHITKALHFHPDELAIEINESCQDDVRIHDGLLALFRFARHFGFNTLRLVCRFRHTESSEAESPFASTKFNAESPLNDRKLGLRKNLMNLGSMPNYCIIQRSLLKIEFLRR